MIFLAPPPKVSQIVTLEMAPLTLNGVKVSNTATGINFNEISYVTKCSFLVIIRDIISQKK